jgi:cell division protein FtsW
MQSGAGGFRILMWVMTIGLLGVGMVMIASTTLHRTDDPSALNISFLVKQSAALVLGLLVAIIGARWPGIAGLKKPWVAIALYAVACLGLIAAKLVGPRINGAQRWLDLGPINVQPSEIAKIAMVVALAWYLNVIAERVRVVWYGVLLPGVALAFMAVLILLTKDLGSVVILAGLFWWMLFFAGANWWYLTSLLIFVMPAAWYVLVFMETYRLERMLAFLDPWNTPSSAGYHLQQSSMAIADGGWYGKGLGQGMSKNSFLPECHTDFIYAVIAEELGLIGAGAVAIAFFLLIMAGCGIAWRAGDRHGRLLAIGATVLLGMQAFGNMLVVTGALPTKGLTLPFISYGGSSVFVSLVLVGLLDAVARAAPARVMDEELVNWRLGASVRA